MPPRMVERIQQLTGRPPRRLVSRSFLTNLQRAKARTFFREFCPSRNRRQVEPRGCYFPPAHCPLPRPVCTPTTAECMHICLRASVVRPARLRCCPCLRDQPPFLAALRGSQCRRRSSAPQRPSRRTIGLPSFRQPHALTCPRSLALVLGDLHRDRGDSKKVCGKKKQDSSPRSVKRGRTIMGDESSPVRIWKGALGKSGKPASSASGTVEAPLMMGRALQVGSASSKPQASSSRKQVAPKPKAEAEDDS